MRSERLRSRFAALVVVLMIIEAGAVTPASTFASAAPTRLAPALAPTAPTTVVPYGAGGWKYQQTSQGGLPGFETPPPTPPGFDDSAWPSGSAPFGSAGGCPTAPGVATPWAINTDMLLRRPMSIPAGTQGVEIWIVVDNDAIGVYWNGALIGGPTTHEGCANPDQPMRFAVSAASVTGSDLLAIRLRDRGSEAYGNIQVVSGAMPSEPATCDVQCLENGGFLGDPVQSFTGAFTYSAVDVTIGGRGPAPTFGRSYSSRDERIGPMGPGWMHNFYARIRHPGDGSPDLLFVGPDGNTDRFTRNNDETYSPPPAVYRTLVRNVDGSFVVTEKSQFRWSFDASGTLTALTDRYGNTSTLGYNGAGELVSVADPAGRGSLTLAYTGGKLTSLTDWASPTRTVGYQYDAQGRLWKVTDREGKVTTFGYDGTSSRLTTITDARGHVAITLTYDPQGRVASQKDAQGLVTGAVITFGYVVNGDGTRVTTVTEPPTSFEPTFSPTTVDTYSPQGYLTSRVSQPSSNETVTETYVYDAIGNRTAIVDPRGSTTNLCYDRNYSGGTISGSRGNLTRVIGPAATGGANRPVTLIAYDAKNNVSQTVTPMGAPSGTTVTCSTNLAAIDVDFATDLAYDAPGAKLLSVTRRYTDPDTGATTAVTKYEYGDAANPGSVTRLIPPRGNTGGSPDYTFATSLVYFATGSRAGLVESVTDALGNKITYDYDSVGRLVSSVDPLGNASGGVPADHRTEITYDKEDRVRFVRLPAATAGGAQLVSETRYDEVGNAVVRVDANGQVSTYSFDDRDALLQVKESPNPWTDPASPPAVITMANAYDSAGNLTRMTRAQGDATYERATDYVYDGRGLLRRETQYPAWPTPSPTLVATSTYDANANLSVATDQLGRTTSLAYDALSRLTSLDYSAAGTPDVAYGYDANDNRTSMTDGTGATSYVYDEVSRLVSVTTPGPKTVGYRYDRDGNRTKLIYPDATAVTYTFDKASRLSGLSDWASRTVGYTYFPDGALKDTTNPNGTTATYGYDNARRLTGITHARAGTTLTQHTYTLDPVGNVSAVSEFVQGITAGGGWSQSVRVNDDAGSTSQLVPDVALGPNGAAIAVWWDYRSTPDYDIYSSRRDPASGAWAANQRVNDVTTGEQWYPAIAIDASNNAYAVWVDTRNGRRDIYFSKRAAATGIWSANVRVNTATTFSDQTTPAIAVSGTGAAVAVWYRKVGTNKYHIYSARLAAGATTWGPEIKLTTDQSAQKQGPKVTIGPDGTAYAVWMQPSVNNADVWFATLAPGASAWTGHAKISDDPGTAYQGQPDIGIDSAGNLTVVWDDWRVSPNQLRVRRRPAGGAWTPSTVIAADGANFPSLSVRADGRAYVTWYDGSNALYPNVWGAEYDPTTATWSAPEQIDANGPQDGASSPAVAMDANQTAVVWQNATHLPSGGNDNDIFSRVRSAAGGTDAFAYTYDRLYRLTGVTNPGDDAAYTYDPAGNRLSRTLGAASTTYAYDRADRISTAGATSITVDAVGATTARGADTFAYDQVNRLTTASVAGTTETYAYDGDGVRFSRQVGSDPAIRHVSDTNRALPVTLDDGTRKYVWGLGLAYADAGSTVEVYHADRLGSVRAITDASGTVIASYRTDEFGIATVSTGSSTQPLGFTGEPRDASGLTYLRARYYDATLGRFMSRDPRGGHRDVSQTLNRYGYVGGNPTTHTDHSGLCQDPGGPGVRYCIEAFIPEPIASVPGVGDFLGDNRGPDPAGGTFRFHQAIFQLPDGTPTSVSAFGISRSTDGRERQSDLWFCGAVQANVLGGRDISATCSASDGLLHPPVSSWLLQAPAVGYVIKIEERNGKARVLTAVGTKYPSYELWQYGNGDPRLLFHYNSQAAGVGPLFDFWEWVPLPNSAGG